MDVQTILADKNRVAVVEELSRQERSAEEIAKRNHLPQVGVERAIRYLQAEGIVGGPDTKLYLTEEGKVLLHEALGLERSGEAVGSPGTTPSELKLGPEQSRKRKENRGT